MCRIVVYLDHQTVRITGNRRLRHRRYILVGTGRVGRIRDHRKMGLGAEHRNCAEIQGIPGGSLKGTDSSLAEDYIGIALCNNIFGSVEPFVNGSAEPAF